MSTRKKRKKWKNPEDRWLRKNRGDWNASTGRDYDKEKAFKNKPSEKKKKKVRAKDRRKAVKEGRVKKNDGKDVHHSGGIGSGKGTKVESKSKNRGRREKSRRKGSKRKKNAR